MGRPAQGDERARGVRRQHLFLSFARSLALLLSFSLPVAAKRIGCVRACLCLSVCQPASLSNRPVGTRLSASGQKKELPEPPESHELPGAVTVARPGNGKRYGAQMGEGEGVRGRGPVSDAVRRREEGMAMAIARLWRIEKHLTD